MESGEMCENVASVTVYVAESGITYQSTRGGDSYASDMNHSGSFADNATTKQSKTTGWILCTGFRLHHSLIDRYRYESLGVFQLKAITIVFVLF